jgi:ABC-type transporter Mla subunit MlaD
MRVRFRYLPLLSLVALAAACGRSGGRTVFVDVPMAGHLKEGSPVKFGGVDIGRVQRLTTLRAGVRLELLILRSDAPIQTDDSVAIRPMGIFGDETVVIVPGTSNQRPLRDGDSLHAAAPDPPSPVHDAFARAAMQELAERLHLVDSTKATRSRAPAARP